MSYRKWKFDLKHNQSNLEIEQQPVIIFDDVAIFFNEFNHRRALRKAPAAEFLISYGPDGDNASYIWMSEQDILKNMLQFPEHKEELQNVLAVITQLMNMEYGF